MMRRARFWQIVVPILLLSWPTGASFALTEEQTRAVRAVNEAYARAWLDGSPEAVLDLFSSEAVLLPPGREPVRGKAAIRAFFWPPDGPPLRVVELRYAPQEVSGDGGTAAIWGTFVLGFEMGTGSAAQKLTSVGNYVMLLRQGTDGGWKLAHYIWNSSPQKP
jgi:uncharacterized protein (TIGR02246 family)